MLRNRRKIKVLVGAGLLTLVAATGVRGNSHEILVRLLTPAALAQQFAQMCQHVEPNFLENDLGHYSKSQEFLEHVKNEVLHSLSDESIKEVVIETTLDIVRQARRRELSLLSGGTAAEEDARVKVWCYTQVRPFLVHVFHTHVSRHDEFLGYLNRSDNE